MAKPLTSKCDHPTHKSVSKQPLRGLANKSIGPTSMNGLISNTSSLVGMVGAGKNFTGRDAAEDRRLLGRRNTLASFPTNSDWFRRPGRSESAAHDKGRTQENSTQLRPVGYDHDRETRFRKCGLNTSEIAHPFRDLLFDSIPPRGSSSIAMTKCDVPNPLVSK
jgi:hypothetical protein